MENKSLDLMERMGVTPKKEYIMETLYDIYSNKEPLQPLSEETIKRIINKHGGNGFIIVTAHRRMNDADANNQANRKLIADLQSSPYSYFPVYGSYEGDYENSFIVCNYDRQGNAMDFENLKEFGISLCDKYEQDCILIKAPNENPIYVNGKGTKINKSETDNVIMNDKTQEYFTALYKKPAGMQRFSYDIQFECYANPNPCTLMELKRRRESGEIILKCGNHNYLSK